MPASCDEHVGDVLEHLGVERMAQRLRLSALAAPIASGALLELAADAVAVDGLLVAIPGEALDADLGDVAAEAAVALEERRLGAGARGRERRRQAAGPAARRPARPSRGRRRSSRAGSVILVAMARTARRGQSATAKTGGRRRPRPPTRPCPGARSSSLRPPTSGRPPGSSSGSVTWARQSEPRKLTASTRAVPSSAASESNVLRTHQRVHRPASAPSPRAAGPSCPRTSTTPPSAVPSMRFVRPTNSATKRVRGRS